MHQEDKTEVSCFSEYDSLKNVILCEPRFMRISQVINETQRRYQKENIEVEKAIVQHQTFVEVLKNNGIETHILPSKEKYPEQVFTRDIGFAVGEVLFISDMKMQIRQGEEGILKEWLNTIGIKYIDLVEDQTEGGDVIIDRKTVYIGLSERTTAGAVEKIQSHLKDYTVIPIPIKKEILHLDCIFNIISDTEALIYKDGLNESEYKLLAKRFDLIEVSKEEQFSMGVNVLSLGNKKIISLPQNAEVNQELSKRGYEVIKIDFSEIIKSGGSFRCCTLPIKRIP
ncbi:dimethylarginine dimethylaminohydrolase family protein [Metabacillus idriensis]|uniref:dimethylarginine dimethylaminohydrolase family protein n=1 Tax=Metabacillus idriensis TaxID=324768 RepID=UPI00174A3220|nr:dimethylarginine dimethylaminohydrolase family protein [Metabacillus idriensis]MCM3594950.1 dimethylarginine dimethylaminohydrolase family protein [Metabacillus idriensis]